VPFVPEPALPPLDVIYTGIELFEPESTFVQFVFVIQLAIGKLKVPLPLVEVLYSKVGAEP
jgi:hypothetical protein